MVLTEIKTDKLLTVKDILAGGKAREKLRRIGIDIGGHLYKINGSNGGPVTIIKENGSSTRLIIGRGLASRIEVEIQ